MGSCRQNHLRVDRNKTKLFNYLSKALCETFNHEGKQLVITDSESILSKLLLCDSDSLSPCNHEEADSLMWLRLHAKHAALHGHLKILTRTVDTWHYWLCYLQKPWTQRMNYGLHLVLVSKHFRHLAVHKIAIVLGIKRPMHFQCFMPSSVVMLCPALFGMVRR